MVWELLCTKKPKCQVMYNTVQQMKQQHSEKMENKIHAYRYLRKR